MNLSVNFPPQLVEFVIDLAEGLVTKYGPAMAKKLWEQAQQARIQKPSFALKGDLVNREYVMRSIRMALNARNITRIIYLYGSGGAGKTRLLEEAKNIARFKASLRWGGIFDLYHTDLHNIFRLESAIIEVLDPDRQCFTGYREKREHFDRKRLDGVFSSASDAAIQSDIASINQFFINELNQFTSKYRVVLAFDTLENIGEEQDLIQQVFRLETGKGSISARQWLLALCREARNTVILLAGRPNAELKADLEQINAIHVGRVEAIPVEGLTQPDTVDLLSVYTRKAPRPIAKLLAQNAINIWQVTKGLPVHVALTVELIFRTPQFLEGGDYGNDPELGRKIVRAFFDSENPERRHLFFLVLARKGLTPDLLNSLERKWSREECSKRLTDAESLSLTKKRPGENELFLHDALYEMFDGFVPYSEEEKVYWYQRLREYYQNSNKGERSRLEKPIVNILYYDLRCDFLQAFYRNFIRWSEIAIKGYEMELDAQLRNEVLIYMRNDKHQNTKVNEFETIFIQDSATRWIRRLITQEHYDQAIELAKTLLSLGEEKYLTFISSPLLINIPEESKDKLKSSLTNAHPVFWASLLIYYGESLTYLAKEPEKKVEAIFQHAIGLLRNPPFGQDHPLWWFRNRLLGRAYDRLGYLARLTGRYQSAADYYSEALPFYKNEGIVDEFAFTQNNLAFVLALLGDISGAKIAVEHALANRLELGQRYPLASSYNTRGLIRALENPASLDGQRDCEMALSIFEEINTPRGIGLACNALGFMLRIRGSDQRSRQRAPKAAIQWYVESENYFERARELFKDGEKIRLWEAYNELGSLNRDWGCLLLSSQDKEGASQKFAKSLDYQVQALKLAQDNNMRFQEVDTLDDIAEVYLDVGNFEESQKKLESCRKLIPSGFDLNNVSVQSNSGDIYWLSLAKIQLREGIISIQMTRRNAPHDSSRVVDGIRHLLLSFIYFSTFSKQSNYLEQRTHEMVAALKELAAPSELISNALRQVVGECSFDLSALCSALSKEYPYEEFS